MSEKVVVFGTGRFAEYVDFYLRADSPHEVVAFTVDGDHLDKKEFRGRPVVPFEDVVERYGPDDFRMHIGIGYRRLNRARAEKFAAAKAKGYELLSYVSSKAVYWGEAEIGENCFLMDSPTIQPFVRIGDDCIIGDRNHLAHYVEIGDHCFLTAGVAIGGGAKIGEYSFLALNSTIRDGITIGRSNVIGAGAVITRSTGDGEVHKAPRSALDPRKSHEIGF